VEEGIAACIALKVTKYKPDKILVIFGAAAKVTLTYLLIPWCRVLIDKLTGLQPVKKFPAFHGI